MNVESFLVTGPFVVAGLVRLVCVGRSGPIPDQPHRGQTDRMNAVTTNGLLTIPL
jgi:hypothetical protein